MTSPEPTTREIGLFVADWVTEPENLEDEVAVSAHRLREAIEAAFPEVSTATVEAAVREVRDVLARLGRPM